MRMGEGGRGKLGNGEGGGSGGGKARPIIAG